MGFEDGEGDSSTAPAVERIMELPRSLTDGEARVVAANTRFGFDLLRRLHRQDPASTIFLSPLSASMALAMTMAGARGETWEAMRSALRLGAVDRTEINASYRGLVDLLEGLDPAVNFELANSLWHRPSFVPVPDVAAEVKEAFDAEIRGLNFSAPGAADTINGWVAARTKGRIEEIVSSPIPDLAIAFVLNAMFFKGSWTDPFDPSLTRDGPFHLPDGRTETVRFMDLGEHTATKARRYYRSTASYDAVDLPYGGEAFSMTVIVPLHGKSTREVIVELAEGGWEALVRDFDRIPASGIRVFLPRFELEWQARLEGVLAEMGMGRAFSPGADFNRMFPGTGFRIGEVRQKTFVRVDEEGTEAAAVTLVGGVASQPREFRADRPFVVAIRERFSGTVLFLGAVLEAPTGST